MAKTLHPAILKSQELYDEPRDLEAHERALLTAVHIAGTNRSATNRVANELFGYGTQAAIASADLAERQESSDLTKALNVYRAEHERIDQGYEDEVEIVHHMMAAE